MWPSVNPGRTRPPSRSIAPATELPVPSGAISVIRPCPIPISPVEPSGSTALRRKYCVSVMRKIPLHARPRTSVSSTVTTVLSSVSTRPLTSTLRHVERIQIWLGHVHKDDIGPAWPLVFVRRRTGGRPTEPTARLRPRQLFQPPTSNHIKHFKQISVDSLRESCYGCYPRCWRLPCRNSPPMPQNARFRGLRRI